MPEKNNGKRASPSARRGARPPALSPEGRWYVLTVGVQISVFATSEVGRQLEDLESSLAQGPGLRGHAFVHGQPIPAVAHEIVNRRLRLDEGDTDD